MIDLNLIIEKTLKPGYISYFKNDRWFIDALNNNQIFEQEYVLSNLSQIIKKSKVVIDAGAHAGSHTILYKYINNAIQIHAFEPQKKMFELLSHNIQKNNFSNVFLYNYGLANIEKVTTLSNIVDDVQDKYTIAYGTEEISNLGGVQIGLGGEIIKTITIDSLNLDACDFIKLDIEGSEILAIFGGIKTIKKFKPVILFESNHQQISDSVYKEFNIQKQSVQDTLYDLGYKKIICIDGLHNYLALWGNE